MLEALRQLRAIEASSFPHMKHDAASAVINRYTERLRPKGERPRSLFEAFVEAGVPVVEVEAKKPPRKRRDTAGHDRE